MSFTSGSNNNYHNQYEDTRGYRSTKYYNSAVTTGSSSSSAAGIFSSSCIQQSWLLFRRMFSPLALISCVSLYVIAGLYYNTVEAYLFYGACLSAAFSTTVLLSYWSMPRWRRHPAPIIIQRTMTNFAFSIIVIANFVMKGGHWINQDDDSTFASGNTCLYMSYLIQFSVIAGECWMLMVSIDLVYSLTNPFISYQSYLTRYHAFVWTLSVINLGFYAAQQQCQGIFIDGICWIPYSNYASSCFIYFYLAWSALFYLVSIIVLLYATLRLSRGLEATFHTRKASVKSTFGVVVVYVAYGTVLCVIFATMDQMVGNDYHSRHDSSARNIEGFLAYLVGCRGFFDAIVWYTMIDTTTATSITTTTTTTRGGRGGGGGMSSRLRMSLERSARAVSVSLFSSALYCWWLAGCCQDEDDDNEYEARIARYTGQYGMSGGSGSNTSLNDSSVQPPNESHFVPWRRNEYEHDHLQHQQQQQQKHYHSRHQPLGAISSSSASSFSSSADATPLLGGGAEGAEGGSFIHDSVDGDGDGDCDGGYATTTTTATLTSQDNMNIRGSTFASTLTNPSMFTNSSSNSNSTSRYNNNTGIYADANTNAETDADGLPQLNMALRREVLHCATEGIKDSIRRKTRVHRPEAGLFLDDNGDVLEEQHQMNDADGDVDVDVEAGGFDSSSFTSGGSDSMISSGYDGCGYGSGSGGDDDDDDDSGSGSASTAAAAAANTALNARAGTRSSNVRALLASATIPSSSSSGVGAAVRVSGRVSQRVATTESPSQLQRPRQQRYSVSMGLGGINSSVTADLLAAVGLRRRKDNKRDAIGDLVYYNCDIGNNNSSGNNNINNSSIGLFDQQQRPLAGSASRGTDASTSTSGVLGQQTVPDNLGTSGTGRSREWDRRSGSMFMETGTGAGMGVNDTVEGSRNYSLHESIASNLRATSIIAAHRYGTGGGGGGMTGGFRASTYTGGDTLDLDADFRSSDALWSSEFGNSNSNFLRGSDVTNVTTSTTSASDNKQQQQLQQPAARYKKKKRNPNPKPDNISEKKGSRSQSPAKSGGGKGNGKDLASLLSAYLESEEPVQFLVDDKHPFTDHRPSTFQILRNLCGINNELYLQYIMSPAREKLTEGSSGAFIFHCGAQDELLVKTVSAEEKATLLRILPAYTAHMHDCRSRCQLQQQQQQQSGYAATASDSLLVRFLGLHTLTMYGNDFHFVVMKNVFPGHVSRIINGEENEFVCLFVCSIVD